MSKFLEEAYLEATEWNLATLEELCTIKSSSKSRIDRQKSICGKMLAICATFDPELRQRARCRPTRANNLIDEAKSSGTPIPTLLSRHADHVRSI
jgi:hypothetical protein